MLRHLALRVIIFLPYVVFVIGAIRSSSHDAIRTITTEDGDLFKCIDIRQQPSLSHPLLKNHKIQMKPSSYPSGLYNRSLWMTTNYLAQLPNISCPRGTIPILQGIGVATKDFISFCTMEGGGKGEIAGIKTIDDVYGTRVSINIYEPKVKEKTKDFSASWVMMLNNQDVNGIEGIGVGSIVWPSFRGDNFARFHIIWADNQHDGECFDHVCSGFVQVNPSIGLGGRIQPVSVYNGPQYFIDVLLFKDTKTGDWWLAYGGKAIGYFSSSFFAHMKDKSTKVVWGGLLNGPTVQSNFPEMGSGHFASEGFGKAAFVSHIKVVDANNKYTIPKNHKTFVGSSRMQCYTIDDYGQDDGMHVFYGGPAGCNS